MWWLSGGLAVALAAVEMPYDGIDQDLDGFDLVDVDGDGEPSVLAGGGDCNDRDSRVHPDMRDARRDGVDNDCDGADGEDRITAPPLWWLFGVAIAARRAFGPVGAAWQALGR